MTKLRSTTSDSEAKTLTIRDCCPTSRTCFLNKDTESKPYEDLSKYHLLTQDNRDNTFFALDILVNKCRPTSLDRPPWFCCAVKPPVCVNNMTFSEMSVFRRSDDKLMHVIQPGGYTYIYEGVMPERTNSQDDSEDEKEQESLQIKKGGRPQTDVRVDVKLNKYVWRFQDDGNVIYESSPDYFYSRSYDYKFQQVSDNDDDDDAEEAGKSVALKFDVIKFNTFIYTPYVIINQTDLTLHFGEKGKTTEATRVIPPNQSEFFNPASDKSKKKFSIMTANYEWAEPFDISTLGMSGEASLKRSKEIDEHDMVIQKYHSNHLNLGVLISSLGGQYGKTTSVKIVPRYVLVNN